MARPHVLLRALFWSSAYLCLAAVPLSVALFGAGPEGRGFWIEFGVALGLVGYGMLGLQFATVGRFRWVTPYFGTDTEIAFHRTTALLTVGFVLLHPVVLILTDTGYLDYLNPWVNLPRALALVAVSGALVLLIVLSLWRATVGLRYEWWRLTHGVLAVFVMFVGMVHALQVGHYVTGTWRQAAWVLVAALPVGLWILMRAARPWRLALQPWRVVSIQPDAPDVYRLVLEADGHEGLAFAAGQYAWLTINASPWTLQQHPFSMLSGAPPSDVPAARVEFGIKALGDFTGTLGELPAGTPAFLEGPYGAFSLDDEAAGAVFVVGGIGVTPVLSLLRTCRDRRDARPILVINANATWDEIPFRDDLEDLARDLTMTIVHVLESPPEGWQGETGYVTPELLDKQLAALPPENLRYLTCGPGPMMDVVEQTLRARGVPDASFVSERFGWV